MKLRLLGAFLLTALLLVGCGGGAESSSDSAINGTWTIDLEKSLDLDDEIKAALAELPELKDIMGNTSITIDTAKGVLSGKMMGEDLPETKFSIVSSTGNTVKIKEEESGNEIDIAIIDANTISLDGGDMKMVLVRK